MREAGLLFFLAASTSLGACDRVSLLSSFPPSFPLIVLAFQCLSYYRIWILLVFSLTCPFVCSDFIDLSLAVIRVQRIHVGLVCSIC